MILDTVDFSTLANGADFWLSGQPCWKTGGGITESGTAKNAVNYLTKAFIFVNATDQVTPDLGFKLKV